jgi:hypothetical protein
MRLFSTHKEQKTYYSSGEIETIYQTLNNKKDGPYKIFYKNGQLKTIVNFKNGKQINEKINSYNEQGNLIRSVEFKNGFLNGHFEEFYSSGNLKNVGKYKDDNIVEKKAFDENEILKYHYVKSNSEIKVKTLSDFKNELKRIIKMNYFDNLDIEIGIPKWSVYTPIKVKGVYKNFKFNGIIYEICKWHDFEYFYEDINNFYEDLEKINSDKLNIDFIYKLTENGNCNIDFPTENFDYSKLIWEDGTPEEIKDDFQPGFDLDEFCEISNWGNQTIPKIKYFIIKLINSEDKTEYKIKWKNKNSEENDFGGKMGGIISNLLNEGKEEVAKQILSDLFLNSKKKEIENRILKSKRFDFTSEIFFEFLYNSKSFISASILSDGLKKTLLDSIDYIENIKENDNNINKVIDIVNNLESSYNDEIFINYVEKNNFHEGLKHAEILKKILNFFVEETLPHVYDTISNLYLSNNRLIEAESEILKCLQIETLEDDENPEHNFTAAKIYYKKNDLINGLKYYNIAIELGADDDSIKEFENYLIINNLSK